MKPKHSHIGTVTVVGDCACFGAAFDEGKIIYLDLAGAGSSVDAVWARLEQDKECTLSLLEGRAITFKVGEEAGLKRAQVKVEGLSFQHMLLMHRSIAEPDYSELTNTYLIFINQDQATKKVAAHITELVDIPIFPAWHNYLIQQGRVLKLLTPCTSYGGVVIWKVILDKDSWTRAIQQGLEEQKLRLPERETDHAETADTTALQRGN